MSEPRVHPRRWSACRLACVRGDVGFLRDVLPELSGEEGPGEPRLIHYGVYGGPSVLELLAEHGRLELEVRDREGRTALMLAAALPKAGPAGADEEDLEVPLSEIVAAQACAWLVSKGAEIEARDPQGWTALHWAAHAERPEGVSELIRAGAKVDVLDHRGRTPLMLTLLVRSTSDWWQSAPSAAANKVIEALLRAGADVDVRDDHGWTALHCLAAVGTHGNQQALATTLLARGARPSRDRAGRSPADLCAREHSDKGPLDPRTAVAAGPGPYRLPTEPALAQRLLEQLVPEQPDPSSPTLPRTRAALDDWRVWADWLQDQGDARGELSSTSLACVGLGGRKRRRMLETLAHVGLRTYSVSHAGLHCADALAPARTTPLRLKWTHGFLTAATISSYQTLAVSEVAVSLLESEPLLAELRFHLVDKAWPELLSSLARISPCPRLRRLVLEGLPAALPCLDELAPALPGVRSLWLIGQGKILSGRVRWPGVTHLRLRHSRISKWEPGNVDLSLDLPDLTHLDLGLAIGRRTSNDQIDGARTTLDTLARVDHLRLSPLGPEFAAPLLASPTIARLRTLELVGVRGSALEVVAMHAQVLRKLSRVRVRVVPAVAVQREVLLEQLRRELPNLELGIGPGKRKPFAPWPRSPHSSS